MAIIEDLLFGLEVCADATGLVRREPWLVAASLMKQGPKKAARGSGARGSTACGLAGSFSFVVMDFLAVSPRGTAAA